METNQVDPYDENRAMEEMVIFIWNALEIFTRIEDDPYCEKLLKEGNSDCLPNARLAAQKMREHFNCGDYSNIHPQLVSIWETEDFKRLLDFI
jgi:hypothetical protein